MNLTLTRRWLTGSSTIGELHHNGRRLCYTLEDVVRPAGVKVPGKTAIPAGTYEVIITFSQRFQREMPILLNVPMFEGIRIHSGNTDKNTEGCVLVGLTRAQDFIGKSQAAYGQIFGLIDGALEAGERVFLTVTSEEDNNHGGKENA